MSKCIILVTNFQALAPLKVPWFGQIVVFQVDYDAIVLQKIVMTSFKWRHRYCVTEKHHQNYVTNFFPIWVPLNQNFWLRQWFK